MTLAELINASYLLAVLGLLALSILLNDKRLAYLGMATLLYRAISALYIKMLRIFNLVEH